MTAIKERPILFSAPMVRAILEGRKTVTRRIVNDWQAPSEDLSETDADLRWSAIAQKHPRYGFLVCGSNAEECARNLASAGVCPYGRRGERLWVREAWAADTQLNAIAPRELSQGEPIRYPADGAMRQTGCSMITPGKTRPSIHMPRWTSRILLEITNVRVERLQDITGDQAEAEGVDVAMCQLYLESSPSRFECKEAVIHGFAGLWESINGAGAWNANPWVWVVDFKRASA